MVQIPQGLRSHEAARRPKVVIGWAEDVDLPEWGISCLRAKVDTGARTSALHVEDLAVLADGRVRFHVVVNRKHPRKPVAVCAPVVKWGRVRSSTGHYTMRCFVKTRVRIGNVEKIIEVSLVSREKMQYRMLLGRTALGKDFLVDVSKRHALARKSIRKKKMRRP